MTLLAIAVLCAASLLSAHVGVILVGTYAETAVFAGADSWDGNSPRVSGPSRHKAVTGMLTAALLVTVALAVHQHSPSALYAFVPLLGIPLLPLAVIDLAEMRLPTRLNDLLLALTATALLITGIERGDGAAALLRSAESAGLWLAVIGGLWFFSGGRAMGFGDVRLAPSLGALVGWLGWGASVAGLAAAFLLGAGGGVACMVAGRAKARSQVPFGPFLILGAVVALVVGPQVAAAYTSLTGIG